ncbi:MAG: nuclear transport factor 2 family protein, partial [Actinomycetaceae bacterium]
MTEQTTPTTTTAPTPAPHPADVVEEFHRAWTRGEIDRAMTLVAEDVVVRAPGEDLDGRSAYREFLEGFA